MWFTTARLVVGTKENAVNDGSQVGQPVLLVYEDSLFQLRRFADMSDFSEKTFLNLATYLGLFGHLGARTYLIA
jgi:hypothetical protein